MLAGLAASALTATMGSAAENKANTYLELKTWRLHNTAEDQAKRVADYLQRGLMPALERAGSQMVGAFANLIGPDGPYYVTLTQYSSLAAMQEVLTKMASDEAYGSEVQKLGSGPGLPFVRVESSLLRSFDVMPQVDRGGSGGAGTPRIFELRTYESQSFATLTRKVGMFNNGEAQIFQRLGMRPVFFGETIVGPRQPNLTYMLSYDSLAARDKLWQAFGSDPEWKKLSKQPGFSDPEIVENISNVILRPLPFSSIK
jgi:NIPSNAP